MAATPHTNGVKEHASLSGDPTVNDSSTLLNSDIFPSEILLVDFSPLWYPVRKTF